MDAPTEVRAGGSQEPRFAATLTPYRSLGPRGFLIVMVLIGGISFVAGTAFALMGAWPVFGFFGLDVALIYLAFRLNYRAAERRETVEVFDDAVVVRAFDRRGGVREWTFQPYWLRLEMREGEDFCGPLHFVSHGRRISVGAFLSPDERRDFAHALRAALAA